MTIILKFNVIILNMLKDYLGTACNRSFPSLPRVLKMSSFKSKPMVDLILPGATKLNPLLKDATTK